MRKVEDLRAGWEHEQAVKAASEKKNKKNKIAPDADDVIVPDDYIEQDTAPSTSNLFEDSDDDSDDGRNQGKGQKNDEGNSDNDETGVANAAVEKTTQEDLFGDSSEEDSDEELVPSSLKRNKEDGGEQQPSKKRKVAGDADDE